MAVILVAAVLWTLVQAHPLAAAEDDWQTVVQPFLTKHCVQCHGESKQAADFRVDTLASDFSSPSSAAPWVEVMDMLNLGEMPPPDQPRPQAKNHARMVQWIATNLRAARDTMASRHANLRRMNRDEYSNTIRDLFHLRYLPGEDPAAWLPDDGAFAGFTKVGAALMVDSSLLGKYYEAAQRVADRVIVSGPLQFPTHRIRFQMEDMRKKGSGFTYVCGHSGCDCREADVRLLAGNTRTSRGLLYPGTDRMIPVKGLYTIRVRAAGDPGDGDEPVRMFVERQNGREGRIMEIDVSAPLSDPRVYATTLALDALPEARGVYMKVGIFNGAHRVQPGQIQEPERAIGVGLPDFFTFERAMKAAASRGDHAESLRIAARRRSEGWTGSTRPGRGLLHPEPLRKLYVDWIEIEGPLYDQWPPKSHRELFFREENAAQTIAYAREMFSRFLPRAFRRPIRSEELDQVVSLIEKELQRGSAYEDAIRLGIAYTLTSPSFLYLDQATDNAQPRHDYDLASRLSYFLWSSMPDERLFKLAEAGKLSESEALTQEVDRMLEDPKSDALIDGFAAQWLKTDEFLEFTPDSKIYAQFYREQDSRLREYMVAETMAFFEEVLRKDLSVMRFIDSDFVMVNEPLARFYGLRLPDAPGVDRLALRRVALPEDSPRGGLLGQAGVHLRGSDGVRTKPVNRGAYVRDVFFNDPPDPPPPNAGEVEPNIEGQRLTVRQRLLQHQEIEACANCHRSIDPYGLALENFDVTGAWRERQNGEDFRGQRTPLIDASGELPNGRTFSDFEQFKARLLEQDERFRRGLVEKLFLYALGRPATPADRASVDSVAAKMASEGDTMRAAIQGIVHSPEFRSP